MKILITGGTGLVGKHLQKVFLDKEYQVIILSRTKQKTSVKGLSYTVWDIENNKIDVDALCSVDCIVHLAGANVGEKRWTEQQKQTIIDSRVKTSNLIYKTLKENPHQVKTFVSASGSGCYGMQTTDKIYKESDTFGNDFLAQVCAVWENSALQFNSLGIRTVCLRTGVVFANKNSALQKMAMPIKTGLGSALGSGKQIMPIIHIKDLCRLYSYALENIALKGCYNAITVNNTNQEVTREIANILRKPVFMPKVPAFMLRFIFGEMSSILLEGSAVDNYKIKATGFKFEFPTLNAILKDVL